MFDLVKGGSLVGEVVGRLVLVVVIQECELT
jgi:hypothetical protein